MKIRKLSRARLALSCLRPSKSSAQTRPLELLRLGYPYKVSIDSDQQTRDQPTFSPLPLHLVFTRASITSLTIYPNHLAALLQ